MSLARCRRSKACAHAWSIIAGCSACQSRNAAHEPISMQSPFSASSPACTSAALPWWKTSPGGAESAGDSSLISLIQIAVDACSSDSAVVGSTRPSSARSKLNCMRSAGYLARHGCATQQAQPCTGVSRYSTPRAAHRMAVPRGRGHLAGALGLAASASSLTLCGNVQHIRPLPPPCGRGSRGRGGEATDTADTAALG